MVSDAIYNRNAKISERFNVNIVMETLPDDSNMWNSTLDGEVMAGSDAYDVVMPDYWWGCETRGLFLDLHDYDESSNSISPGGLPAGMTTPKYTVSSTARSARCRSTLFKNQNVMFFNKELVDSLNLGDIYEIVESGRLDA